MPHTFAGAPARQQSKCRGRLLGRLAAGIVCNACRLRWPEVHLAAITAQLRAHRSAAGCSMLHRHDSTRHDGPFAAYVLAIPTCPKSLMQARPHLHRLEVRETVLQSACIGWGLGHGPRSGRHQHQPKEWVREKEAAVIGGLQSARGRRGQAVKLSPGKRVGWDSACQPKTPHSVPGCQA